MPPVRTNLILSRSASEVTFVVDDVEIATEALQLIPSRAKLTRLACESLETMSDGSGEVVNGYRVHSLLEAVHLAYVDHRPLILTPDHVWLSICQGLGNHLRLRPELLRERVVKHERMQSIDAFYDDQAVDWPAVIEQLRLGVAAEAPELHDLVMQRFTTTTNDTWIAYCGALLEMASAFFGYGIHPVCGIPAITVCGQADDWSRMGVLIERLVGYGLGFWVERLRPIIAAFIAAAQGVIDRDHWQRIYRHDAHCSVTYVSGWAAELFPYIRNGGNHRCDVRNPLLDNDRPREGIAHSLFPVGLAKVHFRDRSGTWPARGFISGFIGSRQRKDSLALEAVIGWGVFRQRNPMPVINRLRPFIHGPGVLEETIERLIVDHHLDMPFDLQLLYRSGNGGCIPMGTAGSLDILPLADLSSVHSKGDPGQTDPAAGRFTYELVTFGRFSDGSTLCWAQRNGGPEILFVRRVAGVGDWVVAVTLQELVESLLDRSRTADSVDTSLRKRKQWPY